MTKSNNVRWSFLNNDFGEVLVYFFMPMVVTIGLGLGFSQILPAFIDGAKVAVAGGIGSLWGWVTENNIHIYLVVIFVLIFLREQLGIACLIVSLLLMFCGGWIGTLIAIPIFILAVILIFTSGKNL